MGQYESEHRSTLLRVGDPFNSGGTNRLSYFTPISFEVAGKRKYFTAKFDTGSPYTLIGTEAIEDEKFRDDVLKQQAVALPLDISGDKIHVREYKVENLIITKDIVIERVKLLFSEDTQDKVLLGNDIISLFNHGYDLKAKRYYFLDYKEVLKKINKNMVNAEDGYAKIHAISAVFAADDMES